MKNFFIFCFYILPFLLSGPSSLASLRIKIFDVGQGNCVLITTDDKQYGLLVDAGSKEMAYGAIYHELFGRKQQRYWLDDGTEIKKVQDTGDSEDSGNLDREIEGTVDTEVPDKKSHLKTLRVFYQERTLDCIRLALSEVTDLTILVSHPDEDHYNLLPPIFLEFPGLFEKVNAAVFGGTSESYIDMELFFTKLGDSLKERKKDSFFLFAGSVAVLDRQGGSILNKFGKPLVKMARAYSSLFNPESPEERRIEEVLKAALGNQVELSILAMNVGFKEPPLQFDEEEENEQEKRKKLDQSRNTSSIVLKVTNIGGETNIGHGERRESIIIPGDADGCTWDFILGVYQEHRELLQARYLLLSHHGAFENGCSREDILQAFCPKVCLISAGNSKAYHHPRAEILERLQRLELDQWNQGFTSQLSCYRRTGSRRNEFDRIRLSNVKQLILSTLDDGTITFEMGVNGPMDPSRDRSVLSEGPQKGDVIFKAVKDKPGKREISQTVFYRCSQNYSLLLRYGKNLKLKKVFKMIDLVSGETFLIEGESYKGT